MHEHVTERMQTTQPRKKNNRGKRKEQVLKISNNWTKNSVSDIQRNQKNKMSDMEKSLAQKRQVYKDELNAWYKNGQKGPQPQLLS